MLHVVHRKKNAIKNKPNNHSPLKTIKSRGSDSQTSTLPTLPTPDERPRTLYMRANSLYTGFSGTRNLFSLY